VADTDGFTDEATGLSSASASALSSTPSVQPPASVGQRRETSAPLAAGAAPPAASCAPGPGNLCLNGGRFRVEVEWAVASQGASGRGRAVAVTGDTGYFWFFDEANVELMLKVLDGRAVNGKFWVFFGALSNVAYTVTVTDTQTGERKTYVNPDGVMASVADVTAF
jgi:hypothetical protein